MAFPGILSARFEEIETELLLSQDWEHGKRAIRRAMAENMETILICFGEDDEDTPSVVSVTSIFQQIVAASLGEATWANYRGALIEGMRAVVTGAETTYH